MRTRRQQIQAKLKRKLFNPLIVSELSRCLDACQTVLNLRGDQLVSGYVIKLERLHEQPGMEMDIDCRAYNHV